MFALDRNCFSVRGFFFSPDSPAGTADPSAPPVICKDKESLMKILPELNEIRKIAESGDYNVLPLSCEILSDFTTPIEKIQSVFGIKSDRKVSCKCPSCGATLTGTKGDTIQCPYCGTFYTF